MTGVVYDPRYSYLTFLPTDRVILSYSRFGDYHCLWDDTYVENPERLIKFTKNSEFIFSYTAT